MSSIIHINIIARHDNCRCAIRRRICFMPMWTNISRSRQDASFPRNSKTAGEGEFRPQRSRNAVLRTFKLLQQLDSTTDSPPSIVAGVERWKLGDDRFRKMLNITRYVLSKMSFFTLPTTPATLCPANLHKPLETSYKRNTIKKATGKGFEVTYHATIEEYSMKREDLRS